MNNKIEVFVRCDCYHHAMCVNVDKEDSQVYVSQWSYGRGNELNWKDQLRYIWQIITKAKPYEDEIVLDFDKAYDLGKFLTDNCAESKCHEHRMTMGKDSPASLETADFRAASNPATKREVQ